MEMHRLKLPQHHIETGAVGNEVRGAKQGLQIYTLLVPDIFQQVLDVKDAYGIVKIIPAHGNTGIMSLIHDRQNL